MSPSACLLCVQSQYMSMMVWIRNAQIESAQSPMHASLRVRTVNPVQHGEQWRGIVSVSVAMVSSRKWDTALQSGR
jgi:hypothetical protein